MDEGLEIEWNRRERKMTSTIFPSLEKEVILFGNE